MKKICITHKFLLKSGFLVQMNFLARQNFPFFFLTDISNNLLVGNYKEKLRHEANFRGGGNRGKKKKKMSKLPDGSFQENIPARVLRVQ